ncbi:MAG: hypothetical protein SGPRY_003011 [Prymnesium sp.]
MEAFRSVTHPLLSLEDAATLYLSGPADAPHMLFFLAGYPSDHSCFAPLASRLALQCGCLVGVSCMPEYDRESPLRKEGYNMDEMSECVRQAIGALRSTSTHPSPLLTLVLHDWGVMPGLIYANTNICHKVVVFDVLPSKKPDSVMTGLLHIHYQSLFAITFAIHRVSALLANLWLILVLFYFALLRPLLNPIGPRTDGRKRNPFSSVGYFPWQTPDKEMSGSVKMTPYRCYPYYYMLKGVLLGKMEEVMQKLSVIKCISRQPVCYIYGEEKNTQFHCQDLLSKLRETEGCEVVGVPKAGHWCYKHEPELCFTVVERFVFGAK